MSLLTGVPQHLEIPGQVIQGILERAWVSWDLCFSKVSKKPRLKGRRNPLSSLNFPANCEIPEPGILKIRGFMGGSQSRPVIRYKQQHAQAKHDPERRDMVDQIPKEALGACLLKKRASGWHASILVKLPPREIPRIGFGVVGIDPGFDNLLTLSSGEKIPHPKEYQQAQKRLAQAQRGGNKKMVARMHEHIARRVRDRNHKVSRKVVSENSVIFYSHDNLLDLASKVKGQFGKSVRAAAGGQLRDMIRSKSLNGGTVFTLVDNHRSTMTCSICKALTGPKGKAGLAVRYWQCPECETWHARDISSGVHTADIGLRRRSASDFDLGAKRLGQSLEHQEMRRQIKAYYLSEICPRVKEMMEPVVKEAVKTNTERV